MVVVGKKSAKVTTRTGKLIAEYPYSKYGKKQSIIKAHKQLYAIEKSKERAKDHDEGGSPAGVMAVATPIALKKQTLQYSEMDTIDPTPEDYIAFFEDFFGAGASVEEDVTEEDVDQIELGKGIVMEYEHTTNEQIARKIALDHLAEDKNYYTHLIEMENKYGL